MTAELTQEVSSRLENDEYGWLTTVAKSGRPVPRLIWFLFGGPDLIVYTEPNTAKVRHIRGNPRVSLNLDSDGNGGGIVVVGGSARIDAEGADCRDDEPYWDKYGELADDFGLTDAMGNYGTRLRIRIDKVWTTPTEA